MSLFVGKDYCKGLLVNNIIIIGIVHMLLLLFAMPFVELSAFASPTLSCDGTKVPWLPLANYC